MGCKVKRCIVYPKGQRSRSWGHHKAQHQAFPWHPDCAACVHLLPVAGNIRCLEFGSTLQQHLYLQRSPGFPDAELWMIVTALSALSVTPCITLVRNRPGVANQEELEDSQRARLVVGSKRPRIRNLVGAASKFFLILTFWRNQMFNIIRSPESFRF